MSTYKATLDTSFDIKIEKDVPVPQPGLTLHKYPFDKMEVGDSILIPASHRRSATSRAWQYAAVTGGKKKFKSRTVEDGVRIWRVK